MGIFRFMMIGSFAMSAVLCVEYARSEQGTGETRVYSYSNFFTGSCSLKVKKIGTRHVFTPNGYAVPFQADIPVNLPANSEIEMNYPAYDNPQLAGFNHSAKLTVRLRIGDNGEVVPVGYELIKENPSKHTFHQPCSGLTLSQAGE